MNNVTERRFDATTSTWIHYPNRPRYHVHVAADRKLTIRSAVSIGGDSDTIAAIAGGNAEALHGLPYDIAQHGWRLLTHEMQLVIGALYKEAC